MVASVTSNYLSKYAQDDSKNLIDQAMSEFIGTHSNFDIKEELQLVQHRIALELYNISRVVDDGNFHKVLDYSTSTELKLIYDIPVCCKINLEGMVPPLHIKLSSMTNKGFKFIKVFISYKESEPMAHNCDQEFDEPKGGLLRIVGDRGNKPGIKIFRSNILYLTFIASRTYTIEVRPQFIDASKAGSLKFITSMQS